MKMEIMLIHPDAKVPTKANIGDMGYDFYVVPDENFNDDGTYILGPGERYIFSTGVCMKLPYDHGMILKDRSGNAAKFGLHVLAGVLDNSWRGHTKVVLLNTSEQKYIVKTGDRIAQGILIPIQEVDIEVVDELDTTDRNKSGFGSTGR